MSRSYKKYPCVKDKNKFAKDYANRKLRRKLKEQEYIIANGNCYRKVTCSWLICDYKFYVPREKFIKRWEEDDKQVNNGTKRYGYHLPLEEAIIEWEKVYLNK